MWIVTWTTGDGQHRHTRKRFWKPSVSDLAAIIPSYFDEDTFLVTQWGIDRTSHYLEELLVIFASQRNREAEMKKLIRPIIHKKTS